MPERDVAPVVVADLRIALSSDRGDATAHLSGSADALVLDVDEPAALFREVRAYKLDGMDLSRFANVPLSVRSRGRELARLHLTARGKVRVRPTVTGLTTAAATVLSGTSRRVRVVSSGSVVALLLVTGALGRRRRSVGATR